MSSKPLTSTGQPAIQKPFSSVPTLIPVFANRKFKGDVYKAELVTYGNLDGGVRLHMWFQPDARIHNHPWKTISCKLIAGAYQAIEYWPEGNDHYQKKLVTLRAGDPEHIVPHTTYHQIIKIIPGSFSVMAFGPVVDDPKNWGHLVERADGVYMRETPQNAPEFLDALRHLNPHLRPIDWINPYAHLPAPILDELIPKLEAKRTQRLRGFKPQSFSGPNG